MLRNTGLLLPKLGRTRDTLEALFHERRLKLIISMELDSSELTKRFVAADVGISFISRSNVAEEVKSKTLSALKISDAVCNAIWRWYSGKTKP